MNTPQPEHYQSDDFVVNLPVNTLVDGLALLDDWSLYRKFLHIDGKSFSSLLKEYGLHLPHMLPNARKTQFMQLLVGIDLLSSIQPDQWQYDRLSYLHTNGLFQAWPQALTNRLQRRGYTLQGKWRHTITLTKVQNGVDIEVNSGFEGNASYLLDDEDEDFPQKLQITPIVGTTLMASTLQCQLSLLSAQPYPINKMCVNAVLYAPTMRRPFLTPTPDELIRSLLVSHTDIVHTDRELLETASAFYQHQIGEVEMSQALLSRHAYGDDFRSSPAYECLKAVLAERPIKGLLALFQD